MSITETLNQDMKSALRAGNKIELGALRMALAAIKKQEIDSRQALTDASVISLLGKLIKQGHEARELFETAGRAELATKEAAEITIYERYLPAALSDAEVDALIEQAIDTTGANSIKDMGRVMATIKSKATGRVDMGAISTRVRKALSTD